MKSDGEEYLERFTSWPVEAFDRDFTRILARLGVADWLNAREIELLRRTAFIAACCIIEFNDLISGQGESETVREIVRMKLEFEFMAARDRLYASAGWQALPPAHRRPIHSIFLNIFVNEDRLAR